MGKRTPQTHNKIKIRNKAFVRNCAANEKDFQSALHRFQLQVENVKLRVPQQNVEYLAGCCGSGAQ